MLEHRGYHINTDPTYPTMKKVEAIGRGSVHLSLRGLFTSLKIAKDTIDAYEDKKEVVEDGKISQRGRSKQI